MAKAHESNAEITSTPIIDYEANWGLCQHQHFFHTRDTYQIPTLPSYYVPPSTRESRAKNTGITHPTSPRRRPPISELID